MAQIWFAVADTKKQLPKRRIKRGQAVLTPEGGLAEFLQSRAQHQAEKREAEEARKKPPGYSPEEADKRISAFMTDIWLGGDGKIDFSNPKWERGFWKSVRSRKRARGLK